jgi:hypothetical protein
MKKVLVFAVLVLLLFSVSGFAETGIGLSANYPIFHYFWGDEQVEFEDFSVGATIRMKQSILLLDVTALYPLRGYGVAGLFDVGLCFDLFMLRIAALGGLDAMYGFDSENFYWGPNVKANVDLKLGPATVGLSVVIPLTSLISDDDDTQMSLMYFAGVSLNLIYWF